MTGILQVDGDEMKKFKTFQVYLWQAGRHILLRNGARITRRLVTTKKSAQTKKENKGKSLPALCWDDNRKS